MMSYDGHENEGQDHTDLSKSETVQGRVDEKPYLASSPLRYAGFWMRFWAYLLDLIVIGSVNRLVIYPVFRSLEFSIAETSMFAPVAIATAFTYYLYFVVMTKLTGQTLGKMVFGIKVIHLKENSLSWGDILFREWIGRFISTTILIAYVVVAFLPKKQGLHDLFADTTVIHER